MVVREKKADNSLFFNKYGHMSKEPMSVKKRKAFIKK